MKKIILLLCFAAVALIPLSAKAEMTVMTDNEMQMVSGQVSIAYLVGTGDSMLSSTMLKIGISPAVVHAPGSEIISPLNSNKLVTVFQPYAAILVNFGIPQDIIKALSSIN